jgi:hypothetical protein
MAKPGKEHMTDKKPSIRLYLDSLQQISVKTRAEIREATIKLLHSHGIDHTKPDEHREMFLAALNGMADLIQYGELGPTAIDKLQRARDFCGIPVYIPNT